MDRSTERLLTHDPRFLLSRKRAAPRSSFAFECVISRNPPPDTTIHFRRVIVCIVLPRRGNFRRVFSIIDGLDEANDFLSSLCHHSLRRFVSVARVCVCVHRRDVTARK